MGNVYPSKLCQHPACLLACGSLEHTAFSCSQATAARLRSETLQAICSELDFYKVGSVGAELLAVLRAAAMGDHRYLNRLFQRSISADKRRRLNSALSSWPGKQWAGVCLLHEKTLCNLACTIWKTLSPEVQQRPELAPLPCKQTTQ